MAAPSGTNTSSFNRPISIVSILLAVGLSLLVFSVEPFADRYPVPKLADAPSNEFSAYRAAAILEELLAERVPHPTGTPENKRVKKRIIARLDALGLIVEEQRALGCNHAQPQCGFVENVLAKIPGRSPGPAVLLMAHYDSVPASMGVVDDGSGVATLLEVARILSTEAPFENPVVFAFTDGEEAWMLGAEAFFEEHRWATDIGVLINIEGT